MDFFVCEAAYGAYYPKSPAFYGIIPILECPQTKKRRFLTDYGVFRVYKRHFAQAQS